MCDELASKLCQIDNLQEELLKKEGQCNIFKKVLKRIFRPGTLDSLEAYLSLNEEDKKLFERVNRIIND